MNRCPCCPETGHGVSYPFNQHQDPATAALYNQALYHYQSYLYYWSLYNTQFSHNQSLCECYEDRRNNVEHSSFEQQSTDCLDVGETYSRRTYAYPTEYNSYNDTDVNMEVERDDNNEEHDGNDDDNEEFEIDEGFYQFIKQSEKHREERERAKRAMAKTEEYVEVGKRQINASTLAPEEHEEAKRKKAMDTLYGDKALYIMSLEASLQLHYDRHFDTRQPIFWPNIPFKF